LYFFPEESDTSDTDYLEFNDFIPSQDGSASSRFKPTVFNFKLAFKMMRKNERVEITFLDYPTINIKGATEDFEEIMLEYQLNLKPISIDPNSQLNEFHDSFIELEPREL
jgi:hypothetical protein